MAGKGHPKEIVERDRSCQGIHRRAWRVPLHICTARRGRRSGQKHRRPHKGCRGRAREAGRRWSTANQTGHVTNAGCVHALPPTIFIHIVPSSLEKKSSPGVVFVSVSASLCLRFCHCPCPTSLHQPGEHARRFCSPPGYLHWTFPSSCKVYVATSACDMALSCAG